MAAPDRLAPRTVALEPVAFVYIAGGLVLGIGILGFVRAASSIITTIAIGLILALALDPVVGAIRRRWHWTRPTAVLLVMGGVMALALLLVVVLGPQAAAQARVLSRDVPGTVREFYTLPIVGDWLKDNDAAGKVDETVKKLPSQLSDEDVSAAVETLLGGALTALLVVAVALAVLLDGERIVGMVRTLLPEAWVGQATQVGHVFYVAIAQYFGGSLAVAALMGTVVLILCLIFSVPLAPLAAIWAMLTDLIPQVGGFLGGALLGLLALTQGSVVFVVVVGLYVLYMNLENHVISPAVIGPAVDVTPPTTMLAALIGGAAAGVPGALVATPLVGAVKQLYMALRWGREPFGTDSPSLMNRVRRLRRRRHRATEARRRRRRRTARREQRQPTRPPRQRPRTDVLSAEPPGRPELRLKPTFSSVLLVIAAIGAAVILVQVFVAARRTLAWVFATALVAWVLSAIITLLDRWMPRAVALLITVIGVAGIGIGSWVGFGASVGAELADARKSLPPAAEKLERQSATARDFRLAARARALVGELDERFGRGAAVSKAVGTAPAYVVTGVLLLFFLFYGPRYGSGALAQIADPQQRAFVASTVSRGSERARDYVLVTVVQVFVVVVVSSTVFKVLGLPAPFGLGLMIGWFSVVPTMGIVLGGLPAILSAGVRSDAAVFVTVVVVVLGLQLVEAIVVRRRVDERTVRVGPALSLIVALIGFQLYGFGGATYAFVALVLALAILDSWSAARATQESEGARNVAPPSKPADSTPSSNST